MANPFSKKHQEEKISKMEKQLAQMQKQLEREKKKYKGDDQIDELRKPLPKIRTLYKWESLARPFRKKDKAYFLKVAVVVLLFILLAAFLQDIALILFLSALMFIIYVLGTIEPNRVNHEISTRGIKTAGKTYSWKDLKDFFFTIKEGYIVLNVNTNLNFPGRLVMVVNKGQEQDIFNSLIRYLEYHDIDSQGLISRFSEGRFLRLVNKEDETYYLEEILKSSEKKKGKKPVRIEIEIK